MSQMSIHEDPTLLPKPWWPWSLIYFCSPRPVCLRFLRFLPLQMVQVVANRTSSTPPEKHPMMWRHGALIPLLMEILDRVDRVHQMDNPGMSNTLPKKLENFDATSKPVDQHFSLVFVVMEQAVGFANAVGSEDWSWEHCGTISERLPHLNPDHGKISERNEKIRKMELTKKILRRTKYEKSCFLEWSCSSKS